MKIGWAGLQSVAAALFLAGVFAAPLRGQVAPGTTTGTTGAQQAGAGQPVSDLVPVIVMFTGEGDWDYVGSESGSFGAGGQGYGGGISIPSLASAPGVQPMPVVPATSSVASTTPDSAAPPAPVQALQPARQVTNVAMPAALAARVPTRRPAVKTAQRGVIMKTRSGASVRSAPAIQAPPPVRPAPQPPPD